MKRETSNNFKKADAFLNVRLQDKTGNWRQLKGIPLHCGNTTQDALMELSEEQFKKLIKDGRVELTVNTVGNESIEF